MGTILMMASSTAQIVSIRSFIILVWALVVGAGVVLSILSTKAKVEGRPLDAAKKAIDSSILLVIGFFLVAVLFL